ncbi:hypothetical protein BJV77DRAFT_786203 [Russula vinacea]|nr:hypothetical protein BJV77DRAFT_786203 [Russula vinacea]
MLHRKLFGLFACWGSLSRSAWSDSARTNYEKRLKELFGTALCQCAGAQSWAISCIASQQSNWMAALPEPTLTQINVLAQKTFLGYM